VNRRGHEQNPSIAHKADLEGVRDSALRLALVMRQQRSDLLDLGDLPSTGMCMTSAFEVTVAR
jgi:hypothetical protein